MGEFRDMRVLGFWRWFYLHFFYRVHMRWLHRRGKHLWRKIGPLMPYTPGRSDTFMRCSWCGETKDIP